MNAIGIIPAGGVGARWGHYPKFLLPCGEREWLLDRTIRAMPCETVIVIVCEETINSVSEHIRRCDLPQNVMLLERKDNWNLFCSMRSAMRVEADFYYFAMPDTYLSGDVFGCMDGFSIGAFWTEHPERFGMIRDGQIVDKEPGTPGMAWGCLGWDTPVRDLWLRSDFVDHTAALNAAMQRYEPKIIKMAYYYDMAGWADYADFMKRAI